MCVLATSGKTPEGAITSKITTTKCLTYVIVVPHTLAE